LFSYRSMWAPAVAASLLAVAASQAQASVNQITFEGPGFSTQGGAAFFNSPTQNILLNDFFNKPYSVTFEYDSATPLAGGRYAASVASATVNGQSNYFAGFDVFITESQFNGIWDVMNFVVSKDEPGGPPVHNTQVYFTIVDNEGGLFASTSALPGLIDPTILNQKNGQVWLNGGAFTLSGGVGSVTTQAVLSAGPGGVPEPMSWALMILGLGGGGAALRAQRRLRMSRA